eukprot:s2378_g4.t2
MAGPELLANIARQRILKELQKILTKPRGAEVVQIMAEDRVLDAVLKVQPPLSANGRELRALQRLWSQPEATRPKALPKLEKPRPPNTLFPDPLSNPAPPVVPQPYDFYAVTDFEATCWDGAPNTEMQEIIELPVVLLNAATGEVVDEFQTFVRPLAQPRLSTFCKRLTGISQDDVDDAPTFKEAMKLLMKWLEEKTSGGSVAWVADGSWDLEIMLPKQWRSAFETPMPSSWKEFIDVRQLLQMVCLAQTTSLDPLAPSQVRWTAEVNCIGGLGPIQVLDEKMYIKQVIIRGFKTYKEQTTLDEDFSPGTNVVVGFNGSGKSNFFQAILFVLSDQYSSLRAETRKALLHEGAGQAVLTAYVEVVLDNSDRRIPLDNDTVSIRRLIGVKKDDWLLDGKHATKAEIFGLLEGAGFAKTSPYYIVQQGKVSELTMMTDSQRLGLLKDISGAGVYDERRAESVKIMEDTAMRRTQTEGLVQEIEQKLQTLEEEQRELRECEKLEARRRTLEYDKGFVRSVDTIGRRWGEGPVVSRRCNCKADNEESTDNSESDSEESPGTTLYLRENNASREFASASWRENAKKKPQLGPPDTQLFASGLATLTSQLPQKLRWRASAHCQVLRCQARMKRMKVATITESKVRAIPST